MTDLHQENNSIDNLKEQLSDEQQDDSGNSSERRTGTDRRQGSFVDRRSGWDRRRGPGRRRSDDRRAAEEGEMDDEQFVFIKAIDEYKRVNKRNFPSYTEILEILKALGYRKVAQSKPLNPGAKD